MAIVFLHDNRQERVAFIDRITDEPELPGLGLSPEFATGRKGVGGNGDFRKERHRCMRRT
jgi:hypothetical protein